MAVRSRFLGATRSLAGLSAAALLSSTAFTTAWAQQVINISTATTDPIVVMEGTGTINILASGSVTTATDHGILTFPIPSIDPLGAWAVNVDGTIEVTASGEDVFGISLWKGGVVDVGATGQVLGSNKGIVVTGGSTTIENDGHIAGAQIATHVLAGGSVTNRKTISGGVVFATDGVVMLPGTLVNESTGAITGTATGFGVIMNYGGSLTNAGTIDYTNVGRGLSAEGSFGFSNTGTFKALGDAGFTSDIYALRMDNSTGIGSNSGTVEGRDIGLSVVNGTADITNSGTIRGTRKSAVELRTGAGSATFKQTAGLLEGGLHGLEVVASGATDINVSGGEIKGGLLNATGVGIRIGSAGVTTLTVTGANVSGVAAGIQGGSGAFDLKLLSGSTVTGGIKLGSGNASMQIDTGGTVNGNILGEGGIDSLRLTGAGAGALAGNITGVETLNVAATGTWALGGTSAFANGITVTSGTLRANGTLTGATSVLSGATIGGSGTLAGLTTIQSGGALAPGNSIGTLRFANGLNFGAGSFFDVEIAPGGTVPGAHNDWASVTGALNIDPTAKVRVRAGDADTMGGTYAGNQIYTIATAGNVAGTFNGTVDENFAFLDGRLTYDAANVYLTMQRNAQGVAVVANTPNQQGAAGALAGFDQADPAMVALLSQSTEGAQHAFDLVSGEVHASGQHLIDQTFALFADALNGHGAGMGGLSAPVSPLGYAATDETAVASLLAIEGATSVPAPTHSIWLTPVAGRGTVYANGNASAIDWWSGGLSAGYEVETGLAGGNARFGTGVGYFAGGGAVTDLSSTLSTQGGYVGGYGNWNDGALSLAGAFGYGANHINSSRNIVFGGLNRTATANYWTHTVGASLEASYGFELTSGLTVSPTGTLELEWSGHNGATETGAGSLNATINPASYVRAVTGIGLDLAYEMVLDDGGTVTLRGRAMWEHGFGNVTRDQTLALAGGGAAFTVGGADEGRDRLRIGAELSYQPSETVSLALTYDGVFSASQQGHTGKAGIQFKF